MILPIIVIIVFVIAMLVLITCLSISHVTSSRKPEDMMLAQRDDQIRILEDCRHLCKNPDIDSRIDKILDDIRYEDPIYPAGADNLNRSILLSLNKLQDELQGGMNDMAVTTLDQLEDMIREKKQITRIYKK